MYVELCAGVFVKMQAVTLDGHVPGTAVVPPINNSLLLLQ